MEWFNWILQGGRRELLPELFLDADWLRQLYPSEQQARAVILRLVDAGPLSLSELRLMNKARLTAYFHELMDQEARLRESRSGPGDPPASSKACRIPGSGRTRTKHEDHSRTFRKTPHSAAAVCTQLAARRTESA